MHLQEYANNFIRERIDGPILCTLDELMLQKIGITSKLHRLKLLNVIKGKVSARVYFEHDPYVKCYKK